MFISVKGTDIIDTMVNMLGQHNDSVIQWGSETSMHI